MAVDSRQLKPSTKAIIAKVGNDERWEKKARTVFLALDALYDGLNFVTDVSTGVITNPGLGPDFVFRPGRNLSGNNFSFGTAAADVGVMYDNVFSSIGSVSTGRIDAVVGQFRIRHGNTGNTQEILMVTDTAATWAAGLGFFSVLDAGSSRFVVSPSTKAIIVGRWTGSAYSETGSITGLSAMTLGNTVVSPTAQLIFDPDGGSSTVLSILNSVSKNYLTINTSFLTTTDHQTIDNATASDVLLTLIPHASQSVDILRVRNAADSSNSVVVAAGGSMTIKPTSAAFGLKVLPDDAVTASNAIYIVPSAAVNSDCILIRNSADTASVYKVNPAGHVCIKTSSAAFTTSAGVNVVHTDSTPLAIFSETHNASAGGLDLLSISSSMGSSSTGMAQVTSLKIDSTLSRCTVGGVGAAISLTGTGYSGSPGTATFFGLDFVVLSQGTIALANVVGVNGQILHDCTSTTDEIIGGNFEISCGLNGSPTGTITDTISGYFTRTHDGNVTTSYGVRIGPLNINSGTTTTNYGLFLGDQSGATTSWAIYSEGAQSSHLGNYRIGSNSAPTAKVHLDAGTTAAGTAPLKIESGTSMTSAEAGAIERTTDDLFFTIATGTARKRLLFADPVGGLTSGRVAFATTNGRLTDDTDLTFATDTLTATKIVGATSVKVGTAAGYISSDGSTGATGTFTTVDLKTVTVKDGIITAIV